MRIELNTVYYEIKDNIGYVVINDPPANKMTAMFLTELISLVRQHVVQSVTQLEVKGIIITGNGRHYSSGADVEQLKEIFGTQSKLDDNGKLVAYPIWYQENRNTFNYFHFLNIPVISAINGLCAGSGTELALCSHIRICGNGSILGLPEASFGFMPSVNGTIRYMEMIGLGKALELVMIGETFSADDAMELGLIHGIVNRKETLAYCERLMRFILEYGKPYSKSRVKEYIENFNKVNENISN